METSSKNVLELTENLLKNLNFEHADEMKSSLKDLGNTIIEKLNEDPLTTLGIAFSIGFRTTEMLLHASGKDFQKKIAKAAGAALVYGIVNPILKGKVDPSIKNLH